MKTQYRSEAQMSCLWGAGWCEALIHCDLVEGWVMCALMLSGNPAKVTEFADVVSVIQKMRAKDHRALGRLLWLEWVLSRVRIEDL